MAEDECFKQRLSHVYSNESERFQLKDRNYSRQYAHIYASRLEHNKSYLEEKCRRTWGCDIPLKKISELVADEKCAIIGTLFKQMIYKPNILKEISEENQLEPQPIREKYTDSSDVLILEDDLQRILLVGNVESMKAITGVTAAILGCQDSNSGKFQVEDIIYKDLNPNIRSELNCNKESYVVLLSGLEIGGDDKDAAELLMSVQLLIDLLNGSIGDEDIENKMSKVLRVIIAGNSLSSKIIEKDIISHGKHKKRHNRQNDNEEEKESRDAIDKLDNFLFQLSINAYVDLMPGPTDPTTFTLPQKPIHRCLLPKSGALSTLNPVSNPYECKIEGYNFLGTSGQPVKDVVRITEYEDELEVLEGMLKFGHLAPTAPDTLGCYPFEEADPFIIDVCPDVFFAGNCKKFDWKKYENVSEKHTLLITIPSFKVTKTAVLLNLYDLTCSPISLP
ncbi:hypothetical protein HELRODRAFT_71825 [Helobdella robusta]|uniref:DNA polymerase delta subunit 2 n=1 Tax=Helobdella robusta TaxID=6412 RepID=T1G0S0_HELRO|nr:hypothetical protein HELRODRAFT_71825 [Helobdella robusta]ESO11643.1 hypothetical protein HELRODRAFT_71825 [Helobdella robusta]